MTWKYNVNDSQTEMVVYDHNGEKVKTLNNDGFTPISDTKPVMEDEIVKEFNNNNMELTEYALTAMMDMANENIEKKEVF